LFGDGESKSGGGCREPAYLHGEFRGFCSGTCKTTVRKFITRTDVEDFQRDFMAALLRAQDARREGTNQQFTDAKKALGRVRLQFLKEQYDARKGAIDGELQRQKRVMLDNYIEWFIIRYHVDRAATFLPERFTIPSGVLTGDMQDYVQVADMTSAIRLTNLVADLRKFALQYQVLNVHVLSVLLC
jgi:hypothetical protein